MAILVLQVPSSPLEEAATDANSAEAQMVEDLHKAAEHYHETGELTFVIPSDEGYGTIYEGSGEITEFRIEASDQIKGE